MSADRPSALPFRLEDWVVEPQLNLLVRGSEQRALEPRAMDVLVFLAKAPGRTFSREEILDSVWNGTSVIDGALYRAVSTLRAALEDDARSPRYVQTVPRRGYRLVATPRPLGDGSASVERAPEPQDSVARPGIVRGQGLRAGGRAWRPWRLAGLASGAVVALAALALLFALAWSDEPTRPRSSADVLPASILVEPLRGVDEQAEPIAAAATETLLALLGSVDGLLVQASIAPETHGARRFETVLTGAVAMRGDRVRITATLEGTPESDGPGEVFWGRVVEGERSDFFLLESELGSDLVTALGRPASLPEYWSDDVDPQALRLYLAGRFHLRSRSSDGFRRARGVLEEAVAIEPEYSHAHAALAETYLLLGDHLTMNEVEARERAAAAAALAEALDPAAPETAIAQAHVALDGTWHFQSAEAHARRALISAPNSHSAAFVLAEALSYMGQVDAALDAIDRAIASHPGSLLYQAKRGVILLRGGRFDAAERQFAQVLALQPTYGWPTRYRAYALHRTGRPDDALRLFIEHADADPRISDERIARLRHMAERAGAAGHWRWRLENLEARRARGIEPHPAEWAEAYAGSDRPRLALRWIDTALEQRDDWLLDLLLSPAFDALRNEQLDRRLQSHGVAALAALPTSR